MCIPIRCLSVNGWGCNKAFAQNCNLKEHARTHAGASPFSCDLCDDTFTTQGNLREHIKRHARKRFLVVNSVRRKIH